MSSPSYLISRLIPPAKKAFERLEAYRRNVVWGDTLITLRVRDYAKSKTQRVSLVVPQWHKVELYSETLQRKVPLVMTNKTLRIIEDMGGLDSYLLKTPEAKLKSDPASAVKWEIISKLQLQGRRYQASSGRTMRPLNLSQLQS